jgi:hypothetical protein
MSLGVNYLQSWQHIDVSCVTVWQLYDLSIFIVMWCVFVFSGVFDCKYDYGYTDLEEKICTVKISFSVHDYTWNFNLHYCIRKRCCEYYFKIVETLLDSACFPKSEICACILPFYDYILLLVSLSSISVMLCFQQRNRTCCRLLVALWQI